MKNLIFSKGKWDMKFNSDGLGETVPFPTVDEEGYRVVGLYGPLTDKKAAEIVYSMRGLRHTGEKIKYNLTDEQEEALNKATAEGDMTFTIPDDEIDKETIFESFQFLISTPGGIVTEMLAIYDTMREIRDTMEIETLGVGKVMSAGVPLLAAGTKGRRKIGENCRVMIHSVLGGSMGSIHDLEIEMQEINFMQKQYVKILVEESKMTEEQVWSLLNTRTNNYLSAEEAVKYGIADVVV